MALPASGATPSVEPAGSPRAERALRHSVTAVLLVVVLTVAAGLAVGYGIGHDSAAIIVGGAIVFAPTLVAAAHYASLRAPANPRSAALVAVSLLAVLFVIATTLAVPSFEAAKRHGHTLFMAFEDPSGRVALHARPGGPELRGRGAPSQLVGGRGYDFSCDTAIADGTRWVLLLGTSYWAPEAALRSAGNKPVGSLPAC
jgi:hypothetical protein